MLKEMDEYNKLNNTKRVQGLNPYFNGTCSKRNVTSKVITARLEVLILILMEHAQRAINYECCKCSPSVVLILILMEHAQRVASFGLITAG